MRIVLYYLLLATVVGLSVWRGREDERLAAGTCVLGSVLTILTKDDVAVRFSDFDTAAFLVDCLVLVSFVWIALRSSRFWPMWVAGLQLTATSVHLLKLLDPDLMRFVFGAALAFWSYPILLFIGIGAWCTTLVEQWRAQHRLRQAN
jgi:hypothetical protein